MKRLASLVLLFAVAACSQAVPPPPPVAAPAPEYRVPAMRQIERRADYADFVLVDKSDRVIVLYNNRQPIRVYRGISFGDAPLGHKRFQGDERTPEGLYTIDTRNPQSSYHLSLRISYPNADDRDYAARFGQSPGGDIFIHGQPNGYGGRIRGDWTDGCIAVGNEEIEEMWGLIADGTPIRIRP